MTDRSVPAGIGDKSSYALELDGLRGIAVLLVVAFHASTFVTPDRAHGPFASFVYAGHTGVTLFFVLSAFLLTRPFLVAASGGRPASAKVFYTRRALRILPLYYFVVLVSAALLAQTPADLWKALPYLVFANSFVHVAEPLQPYSDVWWSLATEMQFYLVLPWAALCLRSRLGLAIGAAIVLSWAVSYTLFVTGTLTSDDVDIRFQLSLSLFGRAPAFLFGGLASWIVLHYREALARWTERSIWVRAGAFDLLLLATLFALGTLLTHVANASFFRSELRFPEWHVLESALWAMVVLLVAGVPLRLKRLVANPILGQAGLLSYSIYLIHVPVLWKLLYPAMWVPDPATGELVHRRIGWTPDLGIAMAEACAIILVLSVATYRGIEVPFLRRKERVGGAR